MMTEENDNVEWHPAPDPRDSNGIRIVADEDAQFECSVCGTGVHRFSVKYHGEGQYCPSCWDEVEPHITVKPCDRCGDDFKHNPYDSNLATRFEGEWYRKPDLCNECSSEVFGETDDTTNTDNEGANND